MMSLVHMFRTSGDKLERHEYREKALGEQLKKMISGLDKKHRALEPLKGMISRLDERLYNVENIFLQVNIIFRIFFLFKLYLYYFGKSFATNHCRAQKKTIFQPSAKLVLK